jgi:sulfatase-modifying factor enzyme 1
MRTLKTMPAAAGAAGPTSMIWILGGEFTIESDAFCPAERPVRRVAVDDFWTETRPATISDFRRFVTATGRQAVAERPLPPARRVDRHPVAQGASVHDGTSRAGASPASGYGLVDMAGNVPRNPIAAEHGRDHASATPRPAPTGFRCIIRSGPLLARPGRGPACCHPAAVQRGEPVLVGECAAEVRRLLRGRERRARADPAA